MPIIKNLLGEQLEIRCKYIVVDGLNFIITRREPNGDKSTSFYRGYEATTGHWVASDKTKDGVILDIKKHMHIIKKKLSELGESSTGGLFG